MSSNQQPQGNTFTTGYNKSSLDRYAYRTAATCCAYLLPHLQSLPADFTFLDVGCGPGSITTDLAARFPRAQFTGIDPGKMFIDKAEALAEERGVTGNTSFKVGDVASLDDQLGTFDVVHCHQVLIHLSDPVGALRMMKAVAKREGGIVAAREATAFNGDIFYPLLPGIKQWQELVAAIFESRLGSATGLGPRLLEVALQAGWPRGVIEAGASVWCYSEPAEKRMWTESIVGMLENKDSDWYTKALAVGATEESLSKMAEAWKEWEKRDESWSTFVSAEIVCRNS